MDIQSTVKRNDLFVKLLQTEPYLPKHDLFATQYLHRWIHYWSVSIIDFEQRFSHKYKGVFRTQLKIYDRTFFCENSLKALFSQKGTIVDVWLGSKYVFEGHCSKRNNCPPEVKSARKILYPRKKSSKL